MNDTKKFYYSFIILAALELLARSPFPLPAATYIYAATIYYLLFQVYLYIRHNTAYIRRNYDGIGWILAFAVCNAIMVVRGFLNSDSYWHYKNVFINTGPSLFVFLFIFLSKEVSLCNRMLKFILKYYLLASALLIHNSSIANTGRIMCNTIPVLAYFTKKYRWIIILFVLYSLTMTWGARGWVLRALFGLGLGCTTLLFKHMVKKMIPIYKAVFFVFLISPLVLSYLGYKGTFNVFNMESYVKSSNLKEDDIVDTRTFLYILVQSKLEKENAVLAGVGVGVSYWDDFNQDTGISEVDKLGRTSTESALLNNYFWGGLIGAFLFSMLFWISAYYGIFKSKNNICKLTGVFIMFRWVISFVDEPNAWVCSNMLMFFFMGLCLNRQVRNMDDSYIKNYFKIS